MARKKNTPPPTDTKPAEVPAPTLPELEAFVSPPANPTSLGDVQVGTMPGEVAAGKTRVVIQSRLHEEDLTEWILSTEARDKARSVVMQALKGDSISWESQVTAAEVLLKLDGMTPELEAVLLRLIDPPGDMKQRLRAARLLLGV